MHCKLNNLNALTNKVVCDCYECQWRNAADMDTISVDCLDWRAKSSRSGHMGLKTLRRPSIEEVRFLQPEEDSLVDIPALQRFSVSEVIKHQVSFKINEEDRPSSLKAEEKLLYDISVKTQDLADAVTAATTPPQTEIK